MKLIDFLEHSARLKSPGPGQYEANCETIRSTEPRWKIGNEKRLKENQYETASPGPGTHTLENKYEPKITFGQRLNTSVNHIPGPGEYDPDHDKIYKNIKYSYVSIYK